MWVQGRIHGNEPYGVDTLLTLLSAVGSNGAAGLPRRSRARRSTLHVIPMYNPDGTELNIRQTVLQDSTERRIDLNRDWAPTAFVAAESVAWYHLLDPSEAGLRPGHPPPGPQARHRR